MKINDFFWIPFWYKSMKKITSNSKMNKTWQLEIGIALNLPSVSLRLINFLRLNGYNYLCDGVQQSGYWLTSNVDLLRPFLNVNVVLMSLNELIVSWMRIWAMLINKDERNIDPILIRDLSGLSTFTLKSLNKYWIYARNTLIL
jgi:hypothetical protein